MKKINIFIWIGIGIILVISSFVIFSEKLIQIVPWEEIGIWPENIKKEVVLVVIDEGQGTSKTFISKFKEGMTAFDLLREGTLKLGLTLKTKTYDVGIFIEAIGDRENGQDEKYWLYYVNGELPTISADKKELKSEDKVEFKFEKSPF